MVTASINKNFSSNVYGLIPDIYLKIYSTDISYPDYKFIVKFKVGGNVFYTIHLVPQYNGIAITNISNILSLQKTKLLPLTYFEIFKSLIGVNVVIDIYEYYSGDEYFATSLNFNFYDQYYKTFEYERHINNINLNNSIIISNLDDVVLDLRFPFMISYFNRNSNINLKCFDEYGNVLYNTYLSNNGFVTFNLQRYIRQYMSYWSDIAKIKVSSTLNSIILYHRRNDLGDTKCIVFKNDAGLFDCVQFFDFTEQEDFKSIQYRQYPYLFDGVNNKKGINKIVSTSQNCTINLWSDWLKDISAQYIYNQILRSKEIYELKELNNAYIYESITPNYSSVEYNKQNYNDLINVKLSFEKYNSLVW